MESHRNVFNKTKRGFALAEVLVALFFVTMVTVLIGGLANQVMMYSKKSNQVAGVLELRGKTLSMSKNSEKWLEKMRVVLPPGASIPFAYSSCLPAVNDPASTVFKCPTTVMSDAEINAEPGLSDLTEDGFYKVMSTSIVDSAGVQIAGPLDNPVYMTNDGTICKLDNPATKCPLRTIGYFLRQEVGAASNPKNVKFVIKVEMNPGHIPRDMPPMKVQYMSMNLGTSWTSTATGTCTLPKVFKGVQPDGTPRCEDPQNPCAAGTIQVGYTAAGPMCENLSDQQSKCTDQEHVILDPVQKKLICTGSSPCLGTGLVFTGFYSASGEPMCSSASPCPKGSLQMGTVDGSTTPICKAVKTCDPLKEAVTFNGLEFSCSEGRSIAGEDGEDGSNGINSGLPSDCKPGMKVVVNSAGTGLACVPEVEDPEDPPPAGCKENPALCPVDPVCETGTLGNDAKRVYVAQWKWSPKSTCEDGYVLQNSAGVYVAATHDGRPLGASLPIDIKFATYHEPDGLRVVAEGVYGKKVLFSTCRLSTDSAGGGQYGLEKPPNTTIRSFSVRVPEGTMKLKVDRRNNDSPTYLSIRGICRAFKEQRLNPHSGAKDNANVRNEYQADLEGYKQYE